MSSGQAIAAAAQTLAARREELGLRLDGARTARSLETAVAMLGTSVSRAGRRP